jgi:hypothetical protein
MAFEDEILKSIPCPLNVQGNDHHALNAELKSRRRSTIAAARLEPRANENNQKRSVKMETGSDFPV